MPQDQPPSEHDEIHNEDFQFVLKALLAAYQPVLEEDLKRAGAPESLKEEAESKPPSCEDEIELAGQLFDKFLTEEVALRALPAEARQQLDPAGQWRWCLAHIRCCIIFGWLVCRGPRTFRAFVYYLYRYWICVRQALGTPVSHPLTAEQRRDFQTLVEALADAYKPYLTDQLASVDFPTGIPEEVVAGNIDCLEGSEEVAAVFERLLNVNTAEALLGKAAFDAHSKEPFFWFCRCWCLCAIRFGCCLARARNLVDVLRCLLFYFRCLRECFRPLTCSITGPQGCSEEHEIPVANILRGVEIIGTAAGAFCDHYELRWRHDTFGPFQSTGIKYPGGGPQGLCGVVNGTLGYLETFPNVPPGPVELQLCVFSTQGGAPTCCSGQFELQRNLVYIRGIEGLSAQDPPGIFDPIAQLVDGAGVVRSFGNVLHVYGSALVGGCLGRDIRRYTLSFHNGFVTDPNLPGYVQFWQIDYNTPLQLDAGSNNRFEASLTATWREFHFPPGLCAPLFDYLQDAHWNTLLPESRPIVPSEPPCPPPLALWTSTPLPLINCQSGRYTLRLTTEDTGGNFKHDTQQVWFDNKQITPSHAHISQIAGVDPCSNIDLRDFGRPVGFDCTQPWPANLLGVAFDELIEEGNFAPPSDNFGGYSLWIKKDGTPDPGVPIPIPGPGGPPWGAPFVGTSRVGEPGDRCPNASPSPGIIPPPSDGILAILDMRRLDATCNPAEPALTLKRGECCGYVITLLVWDTSICPGLSSGRHELRHTFPVCICNHAATPGVG
jgi:hypothetical protein